MTVGGVSELPSGTHESQASSPLISAEAPVVLARACELFVLELTLRAAKGQENEKVITRADVVAAIKNAATMDFLRGVVDPSMAPSADEIAAAEEEDLY